jgi:hypothetical protein
MSEMRKGSGAKPLFTTTIPQGLVLDTPWSKLGEKMKGILEHQQSPFAEIAGRYQRPLPEKFVEAINPPLLPERFVEAMNSLRDSGPQWIAFQEAVSEYRSGYGSRIAEIVRSLEAQEPPEFDVLWPAIRSYLDGDESPLRAFIKQHVGHKTSPHIAFRIYKTL